MSNKTYTIKKGDTFWDLEKEWNIPFGTLEKLNPSAKPKLLQIGQEIKVEMPTLVYLIAEPIPPCTPVFNSDFLNEFIGPQQPSDYWNIPGSTQVETSFNYSKAAQNGMFGLQAISGMVSLGDMIKKSTLTSNELWHLQKNGKLIHKWSTMKNGASYWKNNLVAGHRKVFQSAAKLKGFKGGTGTVAKYGGPALLLGDVALDGEIRASHVLTVVLIGAAAASGVGAILAGVYFLTDIGFKLATGSSLNERLDGWLTKEFGEKSSLYFYNGVY